MDWFLYDNGLRHERLNCGFSFHVVIVFLGNNLNPSGQLNLAMLWNRVDIARNKIIKEVAEKGHQWTVC